VQFFQAENSKRTGGFGHSPAELLATEEALLDYCEATDHPGFLGFWEANENFVVLGYGKQIAAEVYEEECGRRGIPIFRRTSGGGTVLQGPGCLNYTVVLPIETSLELGSISGANGYIMERTRTALVPIVKGELRIQGHTDLTLAGLKFSGNAQRRKRRCLLFHGSFLLNFDLDLISRTLRSPEQQPEYRKHRPHSEFITNLKIERPAIEAALKKAWNVTADAESSVIAEVRLRRSTLVEEKYSQAEWNRRS
jgi:lipoate-protein ligase A